MNGDGVTAREGEVRVGSGYPRAQLAKAFRAASEHEDEAARLRAEARIESWDRVLAGMADGSLTIGSRAPVRGLPTWVTPEVVRGGFATGEAAAGGPPLPYEIEKAERLGIAADRRALFFHHLTDAGLAELQELLDSGLYEVDVPEEAALPTVAWLLRAGDRNAALTLLDEIEPFADRLRFTPRPVPAPSPAQAASPARTPAGDAEIVHRRTAGETVAALRGRLPQPAVAAMNEALGVWNPFADELLAHWLETVDEGRVARLEPDGWRERGVELLEWYEVLAARHTRCTKHRRPKENIAILRTALQETVAAPRARPSRPGLLQHAVDSMVRRRGAPGTDEHADLRERQHQIAVRPTHHELAQILVARLAPLPQENGVPAPESLIGPVTEEEALRTGVAAGTGIPASLRQTVEAALAAPIGTLVERGVVPSAEVMAELVPQLVAWTTAQSYRDEALRGLMAAAYRAFRNRRSLLLLHLQHQVELAELPWVRAVHEHRRPGYGFRSGSHATLTRLAELALQGFPGTILPNPLIRELGELAKAANVKVPFVEELAADIFMGAFSGKFLEAARLAGDLLEGTLYERYYGIDYAAIQRIGDIGRKHGLAARTSDSFAALCAERAGTSLGSHRPAENGTVIEQSQILTTHNLAVLVHPIGAEPAIGWDGLARGAFTTVCRLVTQLHGNPRPLGTIKDAAYAWRQAVFFLALCGLRDQIAVIAWMRDEAERRPRHVAERLEPVLDGLRHVLVGGSLDEDGALEAHRTRRFLGWDTGRHWMHGLSDGATRR
ncbi:transcriptional regulator [Actinomadura sp. 9N407]|uniref:transcriptional regulator n=1 Tax=Actinomadura sp. 9N407 TaxID=3375154 RepID=UPI00378A6D1F